MMRTGLIKHSQYTDFLRRYSSHICSPLHCFKLSPHESDSHLSRSKLSSQRSLFPVATWGHSQQTGWCFGGGDDFQTLSYYRRPLTDVQYLFLPSVLPADKYKSLETLCSVIWGIVYTWVTSLSALSQTHYSDCDYIIRQGATGDTFFIISEGQVRKKNEKRMKVVKRQQLTEGWKQKRKKGY